MKDITNTFCFDDKFVRYFTIDDIDDGNKTVKVEKLYHTKDDTYMINISKTHYYSLETSWMLIYWTILDKNIKEIVLNKNTKVYAKNNDLFMENYDHKQILINLNEIAFSCFTNVYFRMIGKALLTDDIDIVNKIINFSSTKYNEKKLYDADKYIGTTMSVIKLKLYNSFEFMMKNKMITSTILCNVDIHDIFMSDDILKSLASKYIDITTINKHKHFYRKQTTTLRPEYIPDTSLSDLDDFDD